MIMMLLCDDGDLRIWNYKIWYLRYMMISTDFVVFIYVCIYVVLFLIYTEFQQGFFVKKGKYF